MKLTLAEQLANKGLVTKESVKRVEAERSWSQQEATEERVRAQTRKDTGGLAALDEAKDVHAFSALAREILLKDFSAIGVVIGKAHRFKADRGFIWRLYQIRDRFPTCRPEQRETFLKRALRRHDPTVELPE
ncbi:hypothetical protein L0Y59_05315 [Candidatus Uhrbacteria bacterium]|nr:hypothetical protein [Candidatus Uhrbacteria bacterium]